MPRIYRNQCEWEDNNKSKTIYSTITILQFYSVSLSHWILNWMKIYMELFVDGNACYQVSSITSVSMIKWFWFNWHWSLLENDETCITFLKPAEILFQYISIYNGIFAHQMSFDFLYRPILGFLTKNRFNSDLFSLSKRKNHPNP